MSRAQPPSPLAPDHPPAPDWDGDLACLVSPAAFRRALVDLDRLCGRSGRAAPSTPHPTRITHERTRDDERLPLADHRRPTR